MHLQQPPTGELSPLCIPPTTNLPVATRLRDDSQFLFQGEALRSEVFDKVERVFLLGLRASDPAMRAKFFQLYNAAIPVTLFDRLRFIVCNQEWEHLADTFWLKQGLVSCLE